MAKKFFNNNSLLNPALGNSVDNLNLINSQLENSVLGLLQNRKQQNFLNAVDSLRLNASMNLADYNISKNSIYNDAGLVDQNLIPQINESASASGIDVNSGTIADDKNQQQVNNIQDQQNFVKQGLQAANPTIQTANKYDNMANYLSDQYLFLNKIF